MSFSPSFFLSNVNAKAGLARTNRFEVIIPIPTYLNRFVSLSQLDDLFNLPNSIFTSVVRTLNGESEQSSNPQVSRYLALQCETAELPGKSLLTNEARVYGPSYKVPYQTQYEEMALTFICTNEFYERKLFDRWLECIMPTDTNNLRYAKDDSTRYMTNIKVVQYDDFIRKIYSVELIDAFPVGIAPQSLNWADDGFHRVTVRFAYQKYRTIYEGEYDLAQAAGAIFGVAGERYFRNLGNNIAQNLFV